MRRIFFNTHHCLSAVLMALLLAGSHVSAQSMPEIPSSVSFGGITVNFDRSAQDLIEEDVKSLMSNRKFWEEKMDRAILHFPIVEGILMDEEVPIDFKYLAVQESSFRPDVVSSSNAVGYWQFKPETARELNLRVDKDVDERKNISSSTHAAAWYLKKNNQQFNNWVATLYSYYQGAGGVKKVVPANWAYAREVTLTGKTDRYMLRFFAHKIALEAGIERHRSSTNLVLLETEYGKGLSFDQIAGNLGISADELKNYNRWLSNNEVPSDREYLVTIPVPSSQVAAVREKLAMPVEKRPEAVASASSQDETGFPVIKKSNNQSRDKNGPVRYELNGLPAIEARAGDQPKTLAKAGGLSAPKFMRYNDMAGEVPLIPGTIYYLAKKNKKASTPFHTARPGDTWQSVSQQYAIRLVNLLKYNRTTSRNYPIQTGQVLYLTKKRSRKQPVEIIAPKETTPITPASPEMASAPVVTTAPAVSSASESSIPDKPSGRKKYTPVLVEKSESVTAATPVQQAPQPTAAMETPAVAAASPASKPVVNPSENDRVVIITQDNADASFKSADETPTVKKPVPTPEKTTPTTSGTAVSSVYLRQKAAAAEREAKDAAASKVTETPATMSYHTVQPGDTYVSVARKYGVTVRELISMNSKSNQGRLIVGRQLIVREGNPETSSEPIASTAASSPATYAPAPRSAKAEIKEEFSTPIEKTANGGGSSDAAFHTVLGGQTYYSIARTYGLTIKDLFAWNDLNESDRLKTGQQLRIKKASDVSTESQTSPRSSAGGSQTHVVASGETLFRIAQTYHINVEDIKRLNNLSGNNVMVGQRLKIPQQ